MANAYHPGAQTIESQFVESLRQDVARHPKDFIVFETRTAAYHFLRDHPADSTRETEPRMVDSGVLGYWQGKTLVVLPLVSSMDSGQATHDKN